MHRLTAVRNQLGLCSRRSNMTSPVAPSSKPLQSRRTRIGLSAGALFSVVGLMAWSTSSTSAAAIAAPTVPGTAVTAAPERSISVHGVGLVEATPDKVTISLGVENKATTAARALQDNSARANELIAVLKAKGVADKDVQTNNLSVSPQYDNAGRRIMGYVVNNSVTATLRDVKGAGALIDAAAGVAGDAIRVNSLQFGISDTAPGTTRARTAAVQDARKQAEQLATAAGVKLGRLRLIQSSSSTPPQPFYAEQARAKADSAPIEVGSQQISVDVDMVFDLEV